MMHAYRCVDCGKTHYRQAWPVEHPSPDRQRIGVVASKIVIGAILGYLLIAALLSGSAGIPA